LLSLPGEVRNIIYTYFFSSVTFTLTRKDIDPPSSAVPKPVGYVALLTACRQTHHEVTGLPLALGTLSVDSLGKLVLLKYRVPDWARVQIENLHVEIQRYDERDFVNLRHLGYRSVGSALDLARVLPGLQYGVVEMPDPGGEYVHYRLYRNAEKGLHMWFDKGRVPLEWRVG
jgi:hypothetical protein